MFEKLVRPWRSVTLVSLSVSVSGPHENDPWISCWPNTDTRRRESYIYHPPAVNALSTFYLAFHVMLCRVEYMSDVEMESRTLET